MFTAKLNEYLETRDRRKKKKKIPCTIARQTFIQYKIPPSLFADYYHFPGKMFNKSPNMLLPLEYEATISPIPSRNSRQRDFQSCANYPSPGEFLVFLLSFFTKEGAAIAKYPRRETRGKSEPDTEGKFEAMVQHTIQTLPLLFSYLPFSSVFVKREREAKRREMRFKGSSWDVLVRPSVVEGYRIRPTIRKSMRRICISICRTREKKHVCRVQEEKEVEGEQQPFRDIKLFDL